MLKKNENAYKLIKVQQGTPTIGAYLSGFDLNDIKDEGVYEEIRRAADEFKVIFMRDQPMSSAAYVEMARHFGKLETSHTVFDSPDEHPEIQKIKHDPSKPIETNQWHTDNTYMAKPSAYTILQAVDTPAVGGDTLWVCNEALLKAMPEPMQEMFRKMDVEHDLFFRVIQTNYLRNAGRMGEMDKFADKQAIHPAVIKHPRTGREQLFVNAHFSKSFVGVHEEIDRDLLAMVFNMAKTVDHQVRLKWEPNTVAIWDNWATMHYATFDYSPYPRSMQRIVVEAETTPSR